MKKEEFDDDKEDTTLRKYMKMKIDLSRQIESDFKNLYKTQIQKDLITFVKDDKQKLKDNLIQSSQHTHNKSQTISQHEHSRIGSQIMDNEM